LLLEGERGERRKKRFFNHPLDRLELSKMQDWIQICPHRSAFAGDRFDHCEYFVFANQRPLFS
jgi:hypothetical protein